MSEEFELVRGKLGYHAYKTQLTYVHSERPTQVHLKVIMNTEMPFQNRISELAVKWLKGDCPPVSDASGINSFVSPCIPVLAIFFWRKWNVQLERGVLRLPKRPGSIFAV